VVANNRGAEKKLLQLKLIMNFKSENMYTDNFSVTYRLGVDMNSHETLMLG
jgi:hypothetical protein